MWNSTTITTWATWVLQYTYTNHLQSLSQECQTCHQIPIKNSLKQQEASGLPIFGSPKQHSCWFLRQIQLPSNVHGKKSLQRPNHNYITAPKRRQNLLVRLPGCLPHQNCPAGKAFNWEKVCVNQPIEMVKWTALANAASMFLQAQLELVELGVFRRKSFVVDSGTKTHQLHSVKSWLGK